MVVDHFGFIFSLKLIFTQFALQLHSLIVIKSLEKEIRVCVCVCAHYTVLNVMLVTVNVSEILQV